MSVASISATPPPVAVEFRFDDAAAAEELTQLGRCMHEQLDALDPDQRLKPARVNRPNLGA